MNTKLDQNLLNAETAAGYLHGVANSPSLIPGVHDEVKSAAELLRDFLLGSVRKTRAELDRPARSDNHGD